MPSSSGIAIFYAILIAPGFIAVMTSISLAAVERDHLEFVLLVWSPVLSLVIDTVYQLVQGPIRSFDQLIGLLFEPFFRVDYIFTILLFSVVVGVIGAGSLLLDIPGRMRRLLQVKAKIKVNPRQPWANFIRNTGSVRVKTTDNQLYEGIVSEWSRAGRPRELRIVDPYWFNPDTEEYEAVGGRDMLFFEGILIGC